MNGQWVGPFTGTNFGTLVVDLDDMGTHYEGRAYAYDANPELLSACAIVRSPGKAMRFEIDVPLLVIDRQTASIISPEQARERFGSNINMPTSAHVIVVVEDDHFYVTARTNIDTGIQAKLPRTRAGEPSEYTPIPTVTNWQEFKAFVADFEPRKHLFRGQTTTHRLRTSFHRKGRADMWRFLREDIPTLYRHLSATTDHVFNLERGEENGAFLNLAQHHGYPTPLLDWSYSPFVGAFFAYRRITNAEAAASSENDKVRIFIFDHLGWMQHFPQLATLTPYGQNFSIMVFPAIENERLIPQQSISTISNVDDIEGYVKSAGAMYGQEFLRVIDLPKRERSMAMSELSVMGITAGSLFPGLDGACEELREQHFP